MIKKRQMKYSFIRRLAEYSPISCQYYIFKGSDRQSSKTGLIVQLPPLRKWLRPCNLCARTPFLVQLTLVRFCKLITIVPYVQFGEGTLLSLLPGAVSSVLFATERVIHLSCGCSSTSTLDINFPETKSRPW